MAGNDNLTVYVLEADQRAGDQAALLLARAQLRFQIFNAEAELSAALNQEQGGCILVALLRDFAARHALLKLPVSLRASGVHLPVIFFGDTLDPGDVRAAFRAGALDVLPSLAEPAQLRSAIDEAFVGERQRLGLRDRKKQRARRFSRLTPREQEVALLVARGFDNGQIGLRLEISHRTVEIHKARAMGKLGTPTLADLIRLRG